MRSTYEPKLTTIDRNNDFLSLQKEIEEMD